MNKNPEFEAIIGTYEEFLLGYFFLNEDGALKQSFAAHDHTASIRCIASNNSYLASGGTDDRVFIYDLKTRKEHCSLNHHNATITSLQFVNNSHIIIGSQDGCLSVVRIGNWQVEKIWQKGHNGSGILDIAVHSSGKFALTLGADRHLVTWNLIKGRQAYVINLNNKSKDAKSLEKICWAPDDVHFLLVGGKNTELWNIESGSFLKCIEHEEKVVCSTWKDNNLFLVGYESGKIGIVDVKNNTKTLQQCHKSRVKSLAVYKDYILSISSDGEIKIWNKKLKEIAHIETGCRLTCMLVVEPTKVKIEKNDEDRIEEVPKTIKRPKIAQVVIEEEDEPVSEKKRKIKKEKKTKKKRKCIN